ncbi:MAG: FHA domain-containing protein [Candidatus Promineifilaceae bacterium]
MVYNVSRNKLLSILLAIFLTVTLFSTGSAQTNDKLVVSFIQTEPRGQATLLRVLFSMSGGLARRQVQLSEIVLDSEATEADVKLSDSPFYIALTLDFSGSMRNSVTDMRDAAVRAVNNAPANAQITIIRFNATVNATPFLTREQAIEDLRTIQRGDADGGTKLYDATYTAIEDVQRIAGGVEAQRAVIVFTDGNDVENIDDTVQFSERSFRDVIDLAQTPGIEVPIYTIGLGNNVDPNLPTMSSETGGEHVTESDGTSLGRAFEQIMASLGRPWLAEALICTTAGVKDAFLRVTTTQGEVLEAPIRFTVETDCLAESFVPDVAITTLTPFQAENRYEVSIDASGSDLVDRWRVGIFSAETELTQSEFDVAERTFSLDASSLEEGAPYTVRVSGIDADNTPVLGAGDNALLAQRDFTHWTSGPTVEPLSMRLRDMLISDDEAFLSGRFIKQNDQFVDRYGWQLKDVNAVAPVPLDSTLFIFSETDDTFQYPLEEIELKETQYELWVSAFDADSNELLSTRSEPFQYTPPAQTVPLWQKLLIALLLLLLLLLLLYLLYLLYKRRKKEAPAPTPFRETMMGIEPIPVAAYDPNPITSIRVNQSPGWPEPYQILYINQWPYTIGRENCDLSLEGDWRVSRTHCHIDYDQGNFYIEDFGSSNGTVVNGERVPLFAQSIIELGRDTILEFEP